MTQSRDLRDYIKVIDAAVPVEACDACIAHFEQSSEDVKRYDSPLYHFNQLELDIQYSALAYNFARRVEAEANEYFIERSLSPFIPKYGFETVRIKKYDQNTADRFGLHVDVSSKDNSRRFLIAILYLNDNNGFTDFPTLNMSVKPQTGRMVLFPPTWQYPHSGRMPTDTNKFIMMTALHYL